MYGFSTGTSTRRTPGRSVAPISSISSARWISTSFYDRCGGPRLDYIYVSPGVRVKDYRTVSMPRPGKKLYPSDHFPVTATVEL